MNFKNEDGTTNIPKVIATLQGILYNEPEAMAWARPYNEQFWAAQNAGLLPHFMWQTDPEPKVNELTGQIIYDDYSRGGGTNYPALQKLNQLLNPGGPITLPDY